MNLLFRLPIRLFCLGACLLGTQSLPAQAPTNEPASLVGRSAALATPRSTVKTFFEAMRAYKAGSEERLVEAVDCIYLGEDLLPEQRLNQGSQLANLLFEAMDGLQFDMESIEENPPGRNLVVPLGAGEGSFEVHLRNYDDERWRISSQSSTPDYIATLEAIVARLHEAEAAADRGYVHELRSPRVTMEAFIKGMNGEDGFTLQEAINTLELNEADRQSAGASIAADLKALIDRIKLIEFSEIPPESDRETYVFFQDPTGTGSIILSPVADLDNPDLKAWRFTKGTLDKLEPLYLKYKDRPLVRGLRPKNESQPLANRIRDWIHANHPSLLDAPFHLRNYQWLGLLVLLGVGIVISRILTLLVGYSLRFWFRRKGYAYDTRLERDFIRPIRISLMAWVWLYGLLFLGLDPKVLEYLRIAAFFITLVGVVWAAYCLVDIVGKYLTEKALKSVSKHDDLLVPIVVRTLKIVIVVAGIVAFAMQVDANPAQIVTGLGLGGLAFALAAKDVVANVFGSITILSDRPFRIGDWITVGDIDGSVEAVGIRSTRIRTFYNSLITVPNSTLTNTHIDNMGERRYRRIKTTLGITYDTPPDRIEEFCEGIRELIRCHPYTQKSNFHVYLNAFSSSSLDILVYCFVETPDWATELREKERLYLDIIRLAAALKVSFAFPTQTLFLHQENSDPSTAHTMPVSADTGAGIEAARMIVTQANENTTTP